MNDTYIKEFEDWLLMGSWDVDTACKILAGFFPTIIEAGVNSYPDGYLQQISNGEAPTEAQQNEYRRIYALFKSDEHDFAAVGLDGKRLFPQSHVDIMKSTVRPCYAIDWAASKRIQPTWLDEAREKDFPVDMPKKETGDEELASRQRLIGVLSNMLQDDSIDPEIKKTEGAIAKYIGENYGVDMPRKGLATDTVLKALRAAKKRLKEDGVK